jgi:hypothetical protein
VFNSKELEKRGNPKKHNQIKDKIYAKVGHYHETYGLCLVLCAKTEV